MSPIARCLICRTLICWIDCPYGGWWRHDQHPDDGHDALPIPTSDTPLGRVTARVDALLSAETDHERASYLYTVLLSLAAVEFELTDGAVLAPRTTD
ncbi:hypothetical protein [Streptomyces sp. NPDC008001]|uniref:hypothetical protein n=1 Tax=Streptomyces sp. NPDC008001 TaxID=3364804 RepID=UPI0036E8AD82